MAETSRMVSLGTEMPPFKLPNVDGRMVSSDDFPDAKGYLVIFACNHCPYVVHVKDELAKIANEYSELGIAVFAICANDIENYPDDSPENMKIKAEEWGWNFPYLFDESQEVAKAYGAVCTPDIFLFNSEKKLVYRGQLDDSRPGNMKPVNGADLRLALDAVVNGEIPSDEQKPSVGCSIKWKPGNAPPYA